MNGCNRATTGSDRVHAELHAVPAKTACVIDTLGFPTDRLGTSTGTDSQSVLERLLNHGHADAARGS